VQALSVFLIAYFAVDVLAQSLILLFHVRYGAAHPLSMLAPRERAMRTEMHEMVLHVHRGVLYVAAVIYGFKRSAHNHPARMPKYKEWLRATPWHAPMPLPLGSPTFQWWDGLVVALAAGLNHWNAGAPWDLLFLVGCTAYAFSALPMMTATGRKWEAYTLALGLSLLIWAVPNVMVMLALSLAMAAIGHEGARRSLYGFPWDPKGKVPPEDPWPMPIYEDVKPIMPARTVVLTVVLVCSWLGALAHVFHFQASNVAIFSIVVGLLGCLIRWGIYCGSYKPPLTLWARIASGRFVLPGYDQALLVPSTAIVLAVGLPVALYQYHFPAPAVAVLSIGPTLLLLFMGGPRLRVWQLTGYHCFSSGTKPVDADG